MKIITVQWHVFYAISHVQGTATIFDIILPITRNARSLYKFPIKLLFISPWKTWAMRRSRLLLFSPDFSKLFPTAVSNEGRPADGLSTQNCFFLPQQDSPAVASSYSFRDLTKLNCNKGDQVYCVHRYTEQLPPQQPHKCAQPCEAQPHQQLMVQHFLHQTSGPVYLWLSSFAALISHDTTPDRLSWVYCLLHLLSKGQIRSCVGQHLR